MINDIMKNNNLKFIKQKLVNLFKLTELYSVNPVTLFNNIRNIHTEYQRAVKKEKSLSDKEEGENKLFVNKKEFEFKINKKKIISPFVNMLFVTFALYFIYSVALYLIFYSTYVKIQETTQYLFTHSKIINTIYERALKELPGR